MMALLPSHSDILAKTARFRHVTRQRPPQSEIIAPNPGQESVWSYPRPPVVRSVSKSLRVEWAGTIVADTRGGLAVVETAGAPVYFFPPEDVRQDLLTETDFVTLCEWKGAAVHFDLHFEQRRVEHAAFSYPDPLTDLGQGYEHLAGWYAFYPAHVDGCFLGGERATPQPGGYYAGWVTSNITGPFKGTPGTESW
ncbi:MAG: DUF427 domain-containing protein [Methyloligellaceae bacterium]